jgi:5'-nucleotidase
MEMVCILVTNDDGVDAPGLFALKAALDQVGKVVVFAPDRNWSVAGHTRIMHKPLRVSRVKLLDGTMAYTTTGAPSDCVALAVLGILPRKPDLVVSGINRGANVGQDLTYSGTVSAAIEGIISGISSMAVSLDTYQDGGDFNYAAQFASRLASTILEKGLPPGTLLNVNVPNVPPAEICGVQVTRLGKRVYRDMLIERQDPQGRNYYWIGGEPPTGVIEEGTDIWALAHNCVSITPIHLDMTEYRLLEKIRGWGIRS